MPATKPQLALIDGNNFYCNCERSFQHWRQNSPIAVVSNNDGCAIALSDEAKAMDIKMGAAQLREHGIHTTLDLQRMNPAKQQIA